MSGKTKSGTNPIGINTPPTTVASTITSNFSDLETEVISEYKSLLNQLTSLNDNVKAILQTVNNNDNRNIHELFKNWQQLEKKSDIVRKLFQSALYDLIRNYDGSEEIQVNVKN